MNNKGRGLDGVSAEHLKHSSNRISSTYASYRPYVFTGFFIHGMPPPSMILCGTCSYR